MADITVTTTSGATRVVTDTLGAAASAQAAATSASAAATSASNAATSASGASTSATNASNSASAAATSETNAAGSASAASTSASAAATSASNAATSASAASTSATNASNSAGAASTSETNAAASASAAATSASAAATSASNAATAMANLGDGSAAAPVVSFAADPDSGFYRIGANNIGAAVGGAKVLDIATTGLSVTGTLSATGVITASAGTVGAPAITLGDATTGIYRAAANRVGIAISGALKAQCLSTGFITYGALDVVGGNASGQVASMLGSTGYGLKFVTSAVAPYTSYMTVGAGEQLGLAVNGTPSLIASSTGIAVTGALSASQTFRTTGYSSPVSGAGVEIDYGAAAAETGRIICHDRTGATAKALQVAGLTVAVRTGAGVASAFTFDSTSLTPGADNTYNFGSASLGWKELFSDNGTINTSDARRKTAVSVLSAAEIAASKQLAGEIGTFKFLHAVAEKGEENARLHIGMTVQRAMEIMGGHGLDPGAYSFICHDAWDAKYEQVQINAGEKVTLQRPVQRQAFEVVQKDQERIEIVDGKAVLTVESVEVNVPLFDTFPMFDADGAPVMVQVEPATDAVLDEEGNEVVPAKEAVFAQRTYQTPRMEEVMEDYEADAEPVFEDRLVHEAGDKYSFRVHELLLFMLAGMVAQ